MVYFIDATPSEILMAQKPYAQSGQVHIRPPDELLDKIYADAEHARRSLNAHISLLLELGQAAYERNGKKVA